MVDKDSKEAARAAARAAEPPPKPASKGLDAMLAEIEKKKKVGGSGGAGVEGKRSWSGVVARYTAASCALPRFVCCRCLGPLSCLAALHQTPCVGVARALGSN